MKTFTTTFGIPAPVENLLEIGSVKELQQIVATTKDLKNYTVVGGCSNLILDDAKKHNILLINLKGVEILNYESEVTLKVAAGENWDDVVAYAVENSLQGIEALSAIPGKAGAAPVQNIGAYGSEVKDVLEKVEVVDKETGEIRFFNNAECRFSYRQSIFKNELKNKYIITAIYLRLKQASTAPIPKYKDVQKHFENDTPTEVPLTEIRQAITEIRWSKLPKPDELPNVGSFFHNPILTKSEVEELQKILPEVPIFEIGSNSYKVAAGYLIDKAGLKGVEKYGVGTYEKNALVLVNKGSATFTDLQKFIDFIKTEIKNKYNVYLQVEPEII